MTTEYIVICASAIGSPSDGYRIAYGWNGDRFKNRRSAKRHGFKERDSDDFNIGVVRDDKLVSLDWMSEPVETDANELAAIAKEINLTSRLSKE